MDRFKCSHNSHAINTQFIAASALLKNAVSNEEWMAGTTFVKYRSTALKKLFPATKTYKANFFFKNNYFGSQHFFL